MIGAYVDRGEGRMLAGVADAFALADAERMAYLDRELARFGRCQRCGCSLNEGNWSGVCAECRREVRLAARAMVRAVVRAVASTRRSRPAAAVRGAKRLAAVRRLRQRQQRARRRVTRYELPEQPGGDARR